MENKYLKNQRKIVSSCYPLRSSSEKVNHYKACNCEPCSGFWVVVGTEILLIIILGY